MVRISYKSYCLFGAGRNPYLLRRDDHGMEVYYYTGVGPMTPPPYAKKREGYDG